MSMTKGTPASSQIVWLEGRVQELEAENERLRAALETASDALFDTGLNDAWAAARAALEKKHD